MPMVRRLDTIFHGLADTYRQQGQGQGQSLGQESSRQAADMSARPQRDGFPDPEERAPGEPDDFGPPRLFLRNADGPQPMAPPLGTLGEYVAFLFLFMLMYHPLTLIVFLSSFSKISVKEDRGLEVVESV